MALTVKQERFCQKYHECGNASEAYRYAYDAEKMNSQNIHCKASQLLLKGYISDRLREMQDKMLKRSEITKERVLEELTAIMESKITDYVELVTREVPISKPKIGESWEDVETTPRQFLEFKDFSQLTERQVRAIESIKEGRNGIELKLHGKSWTIERICKMLGFDAPQKVAQTDSLGNDLDSPLTEDRKQEILASMK